MDAIRLERRVQEYGDDELASSRDHEAKVYLYFHFSSIARNPISSEIITMHAIK